MRRRICVIALLCAAALTAGGVSARPAAATSTAAGNAIINDCEANGQLTHAYTLAELRQALAGMPASVKQYTNCYDVIQKALIQARKTGSAGPATATSSGGSFLPTPVIIVIIILILGAIGLGVLALMRRRRPPGGGQE